MHPKEKIVNDILKQLHPDRDALLKLISSHMTEKMLICIANADHGYAERNLVALKSIIVNTIIPTNEELDYEVLCLTTYFEPDEARYEKEHNYQKHLQSSFCYIILLIANSFSSIDYYHDLAEDKNDLLIRLIESVNYLGKDFQLNLLSFLSYLFDKENFGDFFILTDENFANKSKNIMPTFIFALIYLLLKIPYNIKESELKVLVDYLIEEAKKAENDYNSNGPWKGSSIEFLGLIYLKYKKQQYMKWIKLAKEIPYLITHLKDQDLRNELTKISVLISKNEHLYKKD